MSETLVVAVILLWAVVIVLAVVVLALARQVGVLHERVSPAGALMPTTGPKVGEATTTTLYQDLEGRELRLGGPASDGRATLLLWVSPSCPVCRALVPTARSLAGHERLRLVFASDGDTAEVHRRYARELGITEYPYVVSQPLGVAFAVGKLPFAALIGADGVLKAKGLVNTREHLESLLEAMESGVATLQEFMQRNARGSDTAVKEHVP